MSTELSLLQHPTCSRTCRTAAPTCMSQFNTRKLLRSTTPQRHDQFVWPRHSLSPPPTPSCFYAPASATPRIHAGSAALEADTASHSEIHTPDSGLEGSTGSTSSSAEPRPSPPERQSKASASPRPKAGLRDAFSHRIPPLPARNAVTASASLQPAASPEATGSAATSQQTSTNVWSADSAGGGTSLSAAGPALLAGTAQATEPGEIRGDDASGAGSAGHFSVQVRHLNFDNLTDNLTILRGNKI